jgi:membrane protein implicated in regulation of membrane protease activity
MDTDALYATFTHPKVVTSMLLIGIGLGLVLSALLRLFWGQWYLPVAFAALSLGTVVLYMVWLDRQDIQDERETGLRDEQGQEKIQKPVLVRPDSPPVITDAPARFAIFTNPRIVTSMLLLGIGLGIVLCVLIILFRGTWYLPALFAAITIGTVAAYLYWLDGQDFRDD